MCNTRSQFLQLPATKALLLGQHSQNALLYTKASLSTSHIDFKFSNVLRAEMIWVLGRRSVSRDLAPSSAVVVVSDDSMAMVVAPLSPGLVVRLRELHSASPFILPNQSLRVVGSLERFDAASGIAIVTDAGSSLRVDLEHLRELPLRVGSLFEFIGELQVHPLQELTLKARVGRNVDGMDLRLFDKVLQFRRKFEEEFRTN